jgi:hypothetical protein
MTPVCLRFVHKCLPSNPIRGQLNLRPTLQSFYLKVYINIFFLRRQRVFFLPLRFYDQIAGSTSHSS